MIDRLVLIFLGIFLVIFAIIAISNLRLEGMTTLMGWSALIAGIVCLIRAISSYVNRPPMSL